MAKKDKCPDCPALPAWITTYGDMMSLLLTFFILLLSFSAIRQDEFQKAIGSLQGALGVLDGEPVLTSPIKLEIPITKGEIAEAKPRIEEAMAEIQEQIEQENQQQNVEVTQGKEGIIIRIKDQALFNRGQAEIKPEFADLLVRIGAILAQMPNSVDIEGHTDDVPISNERFPNNHWLSTARALKVLDVFSYQAGIDRQRLSAIGYGEYRPLFPNDSPENQAKNRRVEIKVRYVQGAEQLPPEQVQQLLDEGGMGVAEPGEKR